MSERDDDSFNMNDVMEIFGEQLPSGSGSKTAPAAPAAAPPPAISPKDIDFNLSDEEARILEEYERNKRARREQDNQAKKKKEDEEHRILEEYEKQKREAEEREERERQALEEKRKKEIEAVRTQKDAEQRMKDEERRIIEEYERERQAKAAQDKAEQQAREEKAQAELKALAEKQKAEAQTRLEEQKRQEEELKKKAASSLGGEKQKRLSELLSKVQSEISTGPALAPLPKGPGLPALPAVGGPKAAPEEPKIELPEIITHDSSMALAIMLEESRKCMFGFLAPMIGIKAANNMLAKTVEKARAQVANVLKDVNWKMDGSLREDGSLDMDRLFKNTQGLPMGESVPMFLKALREIVGLRLKAVEAGLGISVRDELLGKLKDLRTHNLGEKAFPPKLVALFYQEIVPKK